MNSREAAIARRLPTLIVRGVGWAMASQGSTQVFGFVTSVVIARLLSPRSVGLAAEAAVFGTLALVIADFGIAAVIVQRPTLSEREKATAFWASVGLGVLLTVVGVGLSWPIASLYGQPRVQGLFAVLSFTFLFTAPGIVQGALLTRELQFRSLETRTIVASGASCLVAITLAAMGFGPWAIVAQSISIAAVSSVLLWRSSPWRPQWSFSMADLRGMAAFAGHTFGSKSLAWAQLNADNFLVGRFIGAGPLGAYSLACSIGLAPLNRIATPITQVFFPAFSRMDDPKQVAGTWLRALRLIGFIVIPLMLGLVVLSADFVQVVFGPKWAAAAPALQFLAVTGLLQALTALNTGILQSTNKARTLFRSSLAMASISLVAFAAGLPWGIEGVALAYMLASIVVQPVFLAVTARAVGLGLSDCLKSLKGVLQAGLGMMLAVWGARVVLSDLAVGAPVRLALLVAEGAIVYAALVAWRAPEVRAEMHNLNRQRQTVLTAPAAVEPTEVSL